jgi:hypothetical protein
MGPEIEIEDIASLKTTGHDKFSGESGWFNAT